MKTMNAYLQPTAIIDSSHPAIVAAAEEIAGHAAEDEEIARRCFFWVRDRVRHSSDHRISVVTCTASDVLKHRAGFCYAKSHLLAALLRANGIPAGLCYQRLTITNDSPPCCLHGLNGIYLENRGWYRVDARGNKNGVDAHFSPPEEKLAFPIISEGEADFPEIWAEPLSMIIDVLENSSTYDEVANNLPDVDVVTSFQLSRNDWGT